MPLGSVKVAALGAWMACRGGYLRSLGEKAPPGVAGAGADPLPRPAVAGAGVVGRPDPAMPPACAWAAAASRRMPGRVLIADPRSGAPAVWAERRTGPGLRNTPWCGRWPRSSGWLPAARPGE